MDGKNTIVGCGGRRTREQKRTFAGPLRVELVDVDRRSELGEGISNGKELAIALGKGDTPHRCSVRPGIYDAIPQM
jgi:hypothetical protein